MGLRVKSINQLKLLVKEKSIGKAAEQQITKALNDAGAKENSSNKISHLNISGRVSSVASDLSKREARKHFYTLPEYDKDPDPAVVLYRACVRRWGRLADGGDVVYELTIRAPRGFVFDVALPRYRIAVEFDGFQYHSSKEAIQRDHAKTEQAARLGWLVFRVGKARVKHDIDTFLDSIQHAMDSAIYGDVTLRFFSGTSKSASFRSQLLSWKPVKVVVPMSYVFEKEP